MSVRPVTIC